MMGWSYGDGMGTGGWIAMIVMMTVFWGLVVLAGVMIFRGAGRSRDDAPRSDELRDAGDPMRILDQRFARSELDREEYEARRAVLRGGNS